MSHDSECGFTLNHLFISVTHITWYIIHFQRVNTKVGAIEINSDSLTGFHGEIGIIKVGNSHIVNGYAGHHGLDIISRILEFHLVVNIFKFGYNFERISVGHISIIVGTAGNEFFTIKEHFIEYIGIVGRTNLKRSFLSRHERNFHPFAIGKAHCRISSRAEHIYLGGIINLHVALGCAHTFNARRSHSPLVGSAYINVALIHIANIHRLTVAFTHHAIEDITIATFNIHRGIGRHFNSVVAGHQVGHFRVVNLHIRALRRIEIYHDCGLSQGCNTAQHHAQQKQVNLFHNTINKL